MLGRYRHTAFVSKKRIKYTDWNLYFFVRHALSYAFDSITHIRRLYVCALTYSISLILIHNMYWSGKFKFVSNSFRKKWEKFCISSWKRQEFANELLLCAVQKWIYLKFCLKNFWENRVIRDSLYTLYTIYFKILLRKSSR